MEALHYSLALQVYVASFLLSFCSCLAELLIDNIRVTKMPRSNLLHRLLPKRPKSKGDGEATSADASTSQSTLRVAGHHSERQNGPEQSVTSIQGEPDADKYGLVLLNPLQEHSEPKYDVDVIAIHGLGGSLYKTWTHENGKLWLRDFLPADVPSARVFSFGYNSNVAFSRETGTLRGYARSLLESIRLERVEPEVQYIGTVSSTRRSLTGR